MGGFLHFLLRLRISRKDNIVADELNTVLEIETENTADLIREYKLFHSDKEVLIDILGGGYISHLFVQKKFKKSVLFCSSKRIYQKGKLFRRNHLGQIAYFDGEQSVDITNVTGVSFTIKARLRFIFSFIIYLLLGIFGLLYAEEQHGEFRAVVTVVSMMMVGMALVFLILYALKKDKWIIIEYPGGEIMSNCNWYSKNNIANFIKNIFLQKDQLTNQL